MELQLNREPVFLNEVIYDGQTEQGVEFDYVLPDYYPDIFKILRCSLTPGISSYSISGTQLFIDGAVLIKILYLSDDGMNINCVEQKYTYSKTLELTKASDKASVYIRAKTDYVNCRAVSGRRFDVRGAVSCKVRACAARTVDVITGAEGLETKTQPLSYCGDRLCGGSQFVIREDIETGAGRGGIVGIIHCDCTAEVSDVKVIAGKAVVKGEAKVKALYLVKADENTRTTEVMEAAVPISRIIDVDGLDDTYTCNVDLRIMDCGLEIKPSDSGENRMLGCDLTVDCKITANRESSISVLTDLFSTEYATDYTVANIKVEYAPAHIKKQATYKTVIECKDGGIEEIFDCRCELNGIGWRFDSEGSLIITGQLVSQAIGRLSPSGTPMFIEKSEYVELTCDANADENCIIEPNVQITDVGFNITGEAQAELRITAEISGCIFRTKTVSVIEDAAVDTDKPKEKNSEYALKMYYADKGEEVFAIAKKYNTRPSAITEENELDEDTLSASQLLLIPIV